MGSVVDSLKRLYRKIGGKKIKGPIAIDDLVDKIADQMEAGGGSGSGSILPITRTTYPPGGYDTEAQWELDKTYGEILSAINSGKNAVIVSEITKDDAGNVIFVNRKDASFVIEAHIIHHPTLQNSFSAILTFGNGDGCTNGLFSSMEDALNFYPGTTDPPSLPTPDDDGDSGTIGPT